MIQPITVPPAASQTVNKFKTVILAAAVSEGLIVVLSSVRHTAGFGFRQAFETAFCAFPLGAIGASVYIWLADKWSILGRVTRTNLTATLKALLIVTPTAMVLSLVGIELRPLHDAQVWIFVEILVCCIISDAVYAGALSGE
ncbi:MAG TPA: hypothetical protein VFW94_13155 [Candidatus Acidoferrales bacterium]|nr:hypothetical protein [Candidatus Acidoferrales bacterium]